MTAVDPLVTHRIPEASEPETCTDALACSAADATALALALGTALLLFAFLLAAAVHVRSARSVTTEECTRVRNEAESFTEFARRVAELDASPTGGGTRNVGALTMVETATQSPLQSVEQAYRETVMAVPHYEVEYDEPLAQHMATEFGDDVASAVLTGQAFTPQLKQTILQRNGRSHHLRIALLEHLDDEIEEIEDAESDYDRIADSVARIEGESLEDASYEDLRAEWYLLEDRERECVGRLQKRQETVQSRRGLVKHLSGAPTLEEYLYNPLEVTHPILSDGTRLLGEIRAARSQVVQALASLECG